VAPATAFTIQETTKTDYLATLRGRVGYANGQNLWFATAGIAMTSIKIEDTFTDTFATAAESVSKSKSKTGWTLGAGYEYAMPNNWSFKAELLYLDFGKVTTDGSTLTAFTPVTSFPMNPFSHSATLKGEVIRVGFNYKF
jgi:outer membrane immunogenic protein